MDKETKEFLENIMNQLNRIENKVDSNHNEVMKKLDSVIEQTADLTEFRTETRDKLISIEDIVKDTQKDLSTMEIVTARNMENIAYLKAMNK